MHRVRSAPDVTSVAARTTPATNDRAPSTSTAFVNGGGLRRRPFLPSQKRKKKPESPSGDGDDTTVVPTTAKDGRRTNRTATTTLRRVSSCPLFRSSFSTTTATQRLAERVAAFVALALHVSCLFHAATTTATCGVGEDFEESGMFLPSSLSSECFASARDDHRKFCVASPPDDDETTSRRTDASSTRPALPGQRRDRRRRYAP